MNNIGNGLKKMKDLGINEKDAADDFPKRRTQQKTISSCTITPLELVNYFKYLGITVQTINSSLQTIRARTYGSRHKSHDIRVAQSRSTKTAMILFNNKIVLILTPSEKDLTTLKKVKAEYKHDI